VRAEIGEHYESARQEALTNGATPEQADRMALAALGDSDAANRQYRKVLLSSGEARVLREVRWESRICAPVWVVWMLRAIPVAALAAAAIAFGTGHSLAARILLFAGGGWGVLIGLPTLPIYTPDRARVYRFLKWPLLALATGLAFGSQAFAWSGALFAVVSYLLYTEWIKMSIRRKLPVSEWPKQLYL
jgi:hypothetical protein